MSAHHELHVVADLQQWGDASFNQIAFQAAKTNDDRDGLRNSSSVGVGANTSSVNNVSDTSASPSEQWRGKRPQGSKTVSAARHNAARSVGSVAYKDVLIEQIPAPKPVVAIDTAAGIESITVAPEPTFLQSECWLDFHPSNFMRALFHVPVQRHRGIATIMQSTSLVQVSEKSLTRQFLTLRERVEFRKRIHCFSYAQKPKVLLYPSWDLDGPDLPYFGDWKPTMFDPLTAVVAGPWTLDGKAMVADAKDRVLQMIEVCVNHKIQELRITSPLTSNFTNQRGWDMKRGPWMAWWSGVRKAAEVVDALNLQISIVCCTENNPYEGMMRLPKCLLLQGVDHGTYDADQNQNTAFVYGIDPFSNMCWNAALVSTLTTMCEPLRQNMTMLLAVLNTTILFESNLPSQHRHAAWNPMAKLKNLR